MIKSALQSSLTNDVKYRSMSVGNVPSSEYLIQTIEVGATPVASVTFDVSAFAGVYRHLQIQIVGRSTATNTDGRFAFLRFNGDSGSNYSNHGLWGQNGSVASYFGADTGIYIQRFNSDANTAGAFGVASIDILDAFQTTKNKTVRGLGGRTTDQAGIYLTSAAWRNNAALTGFTLGPETGNWVAGTRISLYGVTA